MTIYLKSFNITETNECESIYIPSSSLRYFRNQCKVNYFTLNLL